MFLTRRIIASGVAEVVIALAIISVCFTVASLIFIRSTSSPMKFQDVKIQTEIQSLIMKNMYLDDGSLENYDFNINMEEDFENDSLQILTFTGSDQRVLWKQHLEK